MQRHEIDIIPWAKQILALMRSYIFKPIFLGGLKKNPEISSLAAPGTEKNTFNWSWSTNINGLDYKVR